MNINVRAKEIHLGIDKISRSLPIIVQRAIAIITEAKINIRISFKLHKITTEIISATNESQLVDFNLYTNY